MLAGLSIVKCEKLTNINESFCLEFGFSRSFIRIFDRISFIVFAFYFVCLLGWRIVDKLYEVIYTYQLSMILTF